MELNTVNAQQALLAAIIEGSQDAIISKNLQSRVTSWNKAAERMFGYTEQEMLGKRIHILIPDDRLKEEDYIIERLKEGQIIEHYETLRKTKSGKYLQISLTISPIKDQSGRIVGASKIARDITQQKENEERLKIINSFGKSISAHLEVNTILQKVTDVATRLSGAAFGAFFYNKIDSRGESYMLYTLSGAPRESFEKFGMPRNTAIFQPTFEGTGIVRSDDITKDPRYGRNAPHHGMPKGHLPVVSYLAVPVLSQNQTVIGGLFFGHSEAGVFRQEHEDLVVAIASHAAIALDNAKLYQEIENENKRKDQFINFASHELKTPLTTIKGYMQLAKKVKMRIEEVSPKIEKQIDRLENIINDLLDVSKIQTGRVEFNFEKVSLHKLLQDNIDSVNIGQHEVHLDTPDSDVQIMLDYQKISQVITNLLSNAVKYSGPGSTIRISAFAMNDKVRIAVADEGVGIPETEREYIFDEFYRVPGNAVNVPGMGLGLYIAKQIIDAHLGNIWVEGGPDKGSIFYIQLPIDQKSRT